jgi:methionine-S-sulfoxide reductase
MNRTLQKLALALAASLGVLGLLHGGSPHAQSAPQSTDGLAIATFAGGCFWCVESDFDKVEGVVETISGFTGGHTEHPTYRDVCGHGTGHAEAVEITFDPTAVSYEQLLDIFWQVHDPTQLRSAIFYHSDQQRQAAEVSRDRLEHSGRLRRRIVTQIAPASIFWEAEEYHQKYHQKHGGGCGF